MEKERESEPAERESSHEEGEGDLLKLTQEEGEMLGIILAGGLVSMDRMVSADLHEAFGKGQTKQCPFCRLQVDEDAEHIFWERAAWNETRRGLLEDLRRIISRTQQPNRIAAPEMWPKWVRSTGLMPRDPELDRMNEEMPQDETAVVVREEETIEAGTEGFKWNQQGQMVVYTDGGCSEPAHRQLRRAGYGVHYGENHSWSQGEPLLGREQSAARAELRAAVWALEWAREPVEIATDNESVVKGMFQIIFLDKCPMGSHEDLWRRAYEESRRLGLGRVAVRWTKGHATEEDIETGRSTQEDKEGNDAADALATLAVDANRLPPETTGLYHAKRKVAMTVQRMMVACALARKAQMVELKHDRVFREMLERLTGLAPSTAGEDGAVGDRLDTDEVGPLGKSILGCEEALRRAYPGAPWEQGRTIGYYNETAVVYDLMSKRDWGRTNFPYAMMEPLMWYWARVGRQG